MGFSSIETSNESVEPPMTAMARAVQPARPSKGDGSSGGSDTSGRAETFEEEPPSSPAELEGDRLGVRGGVGGRPSGPVEGWLVGRFLLLFRVTILKIWHNPQSRRKGGRILRRYSVTPLGRTRQDLLNALVNTS